MSATAALGASAVIAAGLASAPGGVELAAMAGALGAGAIVTLLAARLREPETLILFGVALSALAGAATALIFNLSPSPIAAGEVMNWLLGSAAGRGWGISRRRRCRLCWARAFPPGPRGASRC